MYPVRHDFFLRKAVHMSDLQKKSPRRARPQKSKRAAAERRSTSLFLIPSAVGVAVFFLAPLAVVLYYSFIENPFYPVFAGLDNYISLLKNAAFLRAVRNTGIFSAMAVPLAIVIPLLFAMLLMKKLPMKSLFRTVLISPLMVPTASVVLIWEVLFHQNGAVNDWLAFFGAAPIDWFKSDFSQLTVLLLFLWKNIGYNMILFMAALAGIPKDVLEAAELDGAGGWLTFWRIKMPYLFSTVFFVGILSLINSFKVFREIYLLTGDYPYDSLYMLQHFMNNMFRSLDYQKLSCAAVIMAAVIAVIIAAVFRIDDKIGESVEE